MRGLLAWRWLYTLTLLALTIVAGSWLANCGGSLDDFGVTFDIQDAQARALLSRARGEDRALNHDRREVPLYDTLIADCRPVSAEVKWIARWLDPSSPGLERFEVCGSWNHLGYRWAIRDAP